MKHRTLTVKPLEYCRQFEVKWGEELISGPNLYVVVPHGLRMFGLLASDRQELRREVNEFGEIIEENGMEYVESGDYPWDILDKAADYDFIGIWFPEKYGGRGGTLVDQCIVDEEFCRANSSVGLALHSATAGCYVVHAFGTGNQKQRWMSPVAEGEATSSIGMTEPDTGSSLTGISTIARKDGDEYVINGKKRWVGNGSKGDWVATLCRTDPDKIGTNDGLSLIVIPTDADGYSAEPISKMGLDALDNAEMEYDDVRVPTVNLLGDQEGEGFRQVLEWLNAGYGRVSVAAANLGMMQGALDRAIAYANEREQGGDLISDYQGIKWKLADMKTKSEVARSQVYRVARLIEKANRGKEVPEQLIEQACIAKLYATEAAWEVASEAVQVYGGNGYDHEYEVEHILRDVRAGTLYEGTSEMLRNTIGKTVTGEL